MYQTCCVAALRVWPVGRILYKTYKCKRPLLNFERGDALQNIDFITTFYEDNNYIIHKIENKSNKTILSISSNQIFVIIPVSENFDNITHHFPWMARKE